MDAVTNDWIVCRISHLSLWVWLYDDDIYQTQTCPINKGTYMGVEITILLNHVEFDVVFLFNAAFITKNRLLSRKIIII